MAASPGAATGEVAFTADEAEKLAADHRDVILVRTETSPEDIHGMHAARGILTARGGMTSHAAVVARGMGRPCVSGAGMIKIDVANGEMAAGSARSKRGDIITIDGATGCCLQGQRRIAPAGTDRRFRHLMGWADAIRRLKVRTNADTPDDAATARKFGAEGIGLCRTEHMFFDADRIVAVRQMILADAESERKAALAKLLPMQRERLRSHLQGDGGACRSPSVCSIRRCTNSCRRRMRKSRKWPRAAGGDPAKLRARAIALHESNPMLGHRGCGWASPIPKSTKCRRAPFWKRRSMSRKRAASRCSWKS